jgi:5,6-dimethylbenzimidazole synthase
LRPDAPVDHATAFEAAFVADFERLVRVRRDVRHFSIEPIPEALIARILDAAECAPSVGLSQPWRFVRVDDRARRASVRESFRRANADALAGYDGDDAARYATLKLAGLDEAPVHFGVFTDLATACGRGLGRRTMPETLTYSTVAAVQNLWLMARALGLGVGWVSILDPAAVAAALDVPAQWMLTAYLCIGYPSATDDTPELERRGWEVRRHAPVVRR